MLLGDYEHLCTILRQEKTAGEEGGWVTEWTDGDTFMNHSALDTSTQARRAEQEGVTSLYTGLIDPEVDLNFGDYYRDETTGITYRVTSIPNEKQTPATASFNLKYFTAERREIPV